MTIDPSVMEWFKTGAMLMGGGLAGAILTGILTARKSNRETPRLTVSIECVPYNLSRRNLDGHTLRVAFDGTEYENLHYIRLDVRNIGRKALTRTPIGLSVTPGGTPLAIHGRLVPRGRQGRNFNPVSRVIAEPKPDDPTLAKGEWLFELPGLGPGDSVELLTMVDGGGKQPELLSVKYFWGDNQLIVHLQDDATSFARTGLMRSIILGMLVGSVAQMASHAASHEVAAIYSRRIRTRLDADKHTRT